MACALSQGFDVSEKSSAIKVLTFGGNARQWIPLIEDTLAGVEITHCQNRKVMKDRYDDIQVLFGWQFPDSLFAKMPDLQWVQNLSVGIESLIENPELPASVRVTNTGRLYGDTIAEYVVWAMITLFRKFNRVMKNQRRRRWEQVFGPSLAGKTIGIAGLGNVGLNVARLASCHGMSTIGFVRPDQVNESHENVSRVVTIDSLGATVGEIDVLVLSLPLTNETRGLINQQVIDKMKQDAIIVNTARAEVADQSAIVRAVKDGRIAGAALDVFEKEPLSRWDPAWSVENILVTPHTSSMSSEYKTRVADLLRENMIRFANGRALVNEIDRKLGF